MTRRLEALDFAIEAVAESFLQNPANYSDERALQRRMSGNGCVLCYRRRRLAT